MFIHIFTPKCSKIKTGLIIDFYLRALRKYSPQNLDKEFKYIEHSLKSIKCPKFFILNTRKKLSTYIRRVNVRKTLPLFLLPADLSLCLVVGKVS